MHQQMLAYIPNDLRFDNLQGTSTAGGCRYRQAIPPGKYGRLYINTNYGIRKALLPQVPRVWKSLKYVQYINTLIVDPESKPALHGRLARKGYYIYIRSRSTTTRVGLLFM